KSACHEDLQRSRSNFPKGMTHCIGSCAAACGGHGQTVSGWKRDTRALASRVFHAPVSVSTRVLICSAAVIVSVPRRVFIGTSRPPCVGGTRYHHQAADGRPQLLHG